LSLWEVGEGIMKKFTEVFTFHSPNYLKLDDKVKGKVLQAMIVFVSKELDRLNSGNNMIIVSADDKVDSAIKMPDFDSTSPVSISVEEDE
jgi:hypothetical protein